MSTSMFFRVMLPFTAVSLMAACASTPSGGPTSTRLTNLASVDDNAVVTNLESAESGTLYTGPLGPYQRSIKGMQRRPILKAVGKGKTFRGQDADDALKTMRPLRGYVVTLPGFQGICSGKTFVCKFDREASHVYVIAKSNAPLEHIVLSERARQSKTSLEALLGPDSYKQFRTLDLYDAIKEGDRAQEDQLLAELGAGVNVEALYNKTRLPRHRDMYITQLRNKASFDSYAKAFELSDEPLDLDQLFNLRAGRLEAFVDIVDSAKGIAASDLARYEAADDVIALRTRVEAERIEAARLAEEKAIAQAAERERQAELARERAQQKRQREAQKARLAREAEEREAREFMTLGTCNIGDVVTHRELWNTETSSGNIFADLLFNASAKEDFVITFLAVVEGYSGDKVKTIVNDYRLEQTRGGGIFSQVTERKSEMDDYAREYIGRVQFYDRVRCR